jgi:hypothetical protein
MSFVEPGSLGLEYFHLENFQNGNYLFGNFLFFQLEFFQTASLHRIKALHYETIHSGYVSRARLVRNKQYFIIKLAKM